VGCRGCGRGDDARCRDGQSVGKRSNPSGILVEVGGPEMEVGTRPAYYQLDEINKEGKKNNSL